MIPMTEIQRVGRVKQSLVHDLRERHDIAPIVVHHRGGIHVATVHACGPHEQDGSRLPLLSTRLAAAGFGTDELICTAEAHTRHDGDTTRAAETKPGELAQAYADDPESDVRESLVATYVRRGSDEATMLILPYRYTDHGGVIEVVFDDVDGPLAAAGRDTDALVAAVNLADDDPARVLWQHVAVEHAEGDAVVAQALVAMFDHGVMLVGEARS